MHEPQSVEIEYTGMRKLTLMENVVKYGALGGGFGAWLTWTIFEGKKEDREEEQRVKEEVERIEAWKKEFIDMEDVVSDDDMLESLNKRVRNPLHPPQIFLSQQALGLLPCLVRQPPRILATFHRKSHPTSAPSTP